MLTQSRDPMLKKKQDKTKTKTKTNFLGPTIHASELSLNQHWWKFNSIWFDLIFIWDAEVFHKSNVQVNWIGMHFQIWSVHPGMELELHIFKAYLFTCQLQCLPFMSHTGYTPIAFDKRVTFWLQRAWCLCICCNVCVCNCARVLPEPMHIAQHMHMHKAVTGPVEVKKLHCRQR